MWSSRSWARWSTAIPSRGAGRPMISTCQATSNTSSPRPKQPPSTTPAAAEHVPAYQRNVEALQAIQPPDVLPSDIDPHLGASWIPRDVIQDFACETFGVHAWQIPVAHNRQEALWSVEGKTGAINS